MKDVSFGEAMRRKYPEWVVLISTVDEAGTPDVMPAGWAMVASHAPPTFAIGVAYTRYTYELIQKSKEFVVAFPGPGLEKAIEYTGSCSGRDVPDKVAQSGLRTLAAKTVACPLLGGCVVNLECTHAGELETGDHAVIAGRVEACHIDESVPARLLNFGAQFFPALPRK